MWFFLTWMFTVISAILKDFSFTCSTIFEVFFASADFEGCGDLQWFSLTGLHVLPLQFTDCLHSVCGFIVFPSRPVCILFLSWASMISLSESLCNLVILLFLFIVTPHRYFSRDRPDLSPQFLNSRSLPFSKLSLISACLQFPSATILPQHVCLRAWLPSAAFDLCVSAVGDCLRSYL